MSSSAPSGSSDPRAERARLCRAALEGLFAGDALSMPVHWYYRTGDILRAFPPRGIERMEAAPAVHPGSIMALHSTRAGGRSRTSGRSATTRRSGRSDAAREPEIVGDVILKGRRHLWGEAGRHYHHGMPAGENTLNAWCARWLMEYLAREGDYAADEWIDVYIERMTADPPAHPDTYAESYHRGFFANLAAGASPLAAGAVTHDTPSMGALVTVAPLALALLPGRPLEEAQETCRRHVHLTHPDESLMRVVDAYVELLAALIDIAADASADGSAAASARRRALVRAAAAVPGVRLERLLESAASDPEVVGGRFSLACYIEDSWPSVCWLAARHGDDPGRALRVNTNLGGENAHRGAVLGTLVGLMSGRCDAASYASLHRHDEIDGLIGRWLERFATPG